MAPPHSEDGQGNVGVWGEEDKHFPLFSGKTVMLGNTWKTRPGQTKQIFTIDLAMQRAREICSTGKGWHCICVWT